MQLQQADTARAKFIAKGVVTMVFLLFVVQQASANPLVIYASEETASLVPVHIWLGAAVILFFEALLVSSYLKDRGCCRFSDQENLRVTARNRRDPEFRGIAPFPSYL